MLKLENINIRINRKSILYNINADFSPGSSWVISGINGSGKSVLGKVISGLIKPETGNFYGTVNTAYSSFELQDQIMDYERKIDSSRLMHGATDKGTPVKVWLSLNTYQDKAYADKLLSMFSLYGVLDQGLRVLSTGEFRKTILLSALLQKPELLVIDDPFDGLDISSRENLKIIINEIAKNNQKIILITSKVEDIFPECTHMLLLSEGKVKFSGSLEKGLALYNEEQVLEKKIYIQNKFSLYEEQSGNKLEQSPDILIDMKDVSVNYGDLEVLGNLNWKVKRGDKWKITGPNGSGKSTLLSLVNGENQQAYANNIYLFGRRRGSGESVWDIKKRIGFVSGDFQLNYRVRTTVLEVLLSGIYDSIGLYTEINSQDKEKAFSWLEFIGLVKKQNFIFRDLSYGEMRMVLLARAMIKTPSLLILDEPCQGLDNYNKDKILDICEKIGSSPESTILFVTHDQTINLNCFTNTLILEN